MQTLVKMTTEVDDPNFECDDQDWHAIVSSDTDRTICGHALDAFRTYNFIEKRVKRGGITCQICKNMIKEIKRYKL